MKYILFCNRIYRSDLRPEITGKEFDAYGEAVDYRSEQKEKNIKEKIKQEYERMERLCRSEGWKETHEINKKIDEFYATIGKRKEI